MVDHLSILTAAILLALIRGYSQEAGEPGQVEPVPGAVQTAAQPLSSEASFFYDRLVPYGQWLWIDPYGWVWSPNNVAAGWRPYTDGHWIYADCGWTWESDLEWGWAPFHYGRWFFHEHRGWCWVPGAVWAPAWVAWHWGEGWSGWAPMPPLVAWETGADWDAVIPTFGWCFVEHGDFRRLRLKEHIALVARNVTLLNATRNVTRFEVRDRGVANLSITAEQVELATGRPVRRFQVAEVNSPGEARGPFHGGTAISVFRPAVRATTAMMPMQPGTLPSPAPADVTFEKVRREEAAHRALQAQQARERATLEKLHESELRTPPQGLSARQLQERHLAEHREFNEHVNRQNQVFEHRQQLPVPQERSSTSTLSQRSGVGRGNAR